MAFLQASAVLRTDSYTQHSRTCFFSFRVCRVTASSTCTPPFSTGPPNLTSTRHLHAPHTSLPTLPEVPWRGARRSGRGEASLPEASAGRPGGAVAATLKRNVEVALGREEGRRRMLGESDGRRANAGTGRRGSPQGVSAYSSLSSSPALGP